MTFQAADILNKRGQKQVEPDQTDLFVSAHAGLEEVLAAFRAGAKKVGVRGHSKKLLGVIEWDALVAHLNETFQVTGARLQSILDSSFDAMCMIDERERVIIWNEQAENLYGIKKKEILGKAITLFFTNLVVTKVLRDRVPVTGAYHQPCPGTYVIINAYPVLLNGKVIGSISVERDITSMVVLNRELIKANNRADTLKEKIEKINHTGDPFQEIYGRSERFRELLRLAKKVAATDAAVLLYGESGTGKEVIARALHKGGSRRDKPFVPINCGAIPYSLFESELFGYEGGAFTGAEKSGKPGKFALAHGGTLFLDEISELHPDLQVKLLRVLQDQLYFPVGGSAPRQVDTRIIAATNQNLEQLVRAGKFRKDLYYRLNVVTLKIPPLRERKHDIPELAYLFLAEFSVQYQKTIKDIDANVMTFLLRYQWHGNIRELRNVIERMVVLTEGNCLTMETMPPELRQQWQAMQEELPGSQLERIKGYLERDLILQTLLDLHGNKAKAAAYLGLPRSTLYYRMKKLGITRRDYEY